jgi:hypothetical protein
MAKVSKGLGPPLVPWLQAPRKWDRVPDRRLSRTIGVSGTGRNSPVLVCTRFTYNPFQLFVDWADTAKLLQTRLEKALVHSERHAEAFAEFCRLQSKHVSQWTQMIEAFEADNTCENPYKRSTEGDF